MFRNIVNYQGHIVGRMELPDDTPESVWLEKLAPYLIAPKTQSEQVISSVRSTVKGRIAICEDLLEKWSSESALRGTTIEQGLWAQTRLKNISYTYNSVPAVIDIPNIMTTGDIEVAQISFMNMLPDDMSQPYHFFTQEILDGWIIDLSAHTGIPRGF